MRMCVDGEIIDAGETTLEVIHNAFNFVNGVNLFVEDCMGVVQPVR
jgi:hypothetical protein